MRTLSPQPGLTAARRVRAAFGVAASLLLVATLAVSINAGTDDDLGISHAADSAATDSLRFQAQLRAGEKPLAPIGQWAYANANGTVRERGYSSVTQTRTQGGGACAYGGRGTSCDGPAARSDATVNDRPGNWDTSWGSTVPAAYVEFLADFTAGARCTADGDLTPVAGTGRFRYGNDSHLNGTGFADYNLTSRGNNITFNHNYQVAPSRSFTRPLSSETWINVSAVRRWGTVAADRRAWSEISVSWTATQSDTPRSGSVTYRAECGLTMNDGSGSSTRTASVMGAAEPFEVEHRETVTVEQDGEVSVIEIDPDTGEPVDEASATAVPTTTPRRQANESTEDRSEDIPESTGTRPTSTQPSSTQPTATQPSTTQPANPVEEPQVDGLGVESRLEQESQDYQLLATRELTAAELDTVREALEDAADASARLGRVDGGTWQVFSGDGRQRPVPVVEIVLTDGTVVQWRPIIDGIELPAPGVQEAGR